MKEKFDKGFKKITGLLAKEFLKEVLPYALLILLAVFLAIYYINPAPPKKIIISSSGAFVNNRAYASIYGALLKQHGIELEVKESSGDVENIRLLKDESSGVDLAFVLDGVGHSEGAGALQSLGSIYYEPAWILCRCSEKLGHLSKLRGRRIAVGPEGDGANVLAVTLLAASGVNAKNARLSSLAGDDAVDALNQGKLDAAIIVDVTDSALVRRALKNPRIHLISLDDAEALTRQNSYLHHLILPESSIDIARNIPSRSVHLVASTTMLVKSENMHPALVYLMMKIIKQLHNGPGILHAKDAFPSMQGSDFPLSPQADNFYRNGPPFLDKYLPFWASTFISRTLIVIVPLLAVLLPLSKVIPLAYRTFMRWRLFRYYGELRYLETQINNEQTEFNRDYYCQKLDEIESRAISIKLPISYSQFLYELRSHINFVRSKI